MYETEIKQVDKKKGGPYTKKQQEERRDEVFRLHFENSSSAVKISKILNVNRNTVDDDIKYWYQKFSEDWKNFDKNSWLTKQILRFESQRARLLEDLEKQEDFHHRQTIEKLLFEIDSKMINFVEKMRASRVSAPTISVEKEKYFEDVIPKFVRFLLDNQTDREVPFQYGEEELLFEIIKMYKYDEDEAREFFSKMIDLGLEICLGVDSPDYNYERYNMKIFAEMRGYLN